MPVSVQIFRARAGNLHGINKYKFTLQTKYTWIPFSALLFPSIAILSFLIYFMAIVSLKKHTFSPIKIKSAKFNFLKIMTHFLIIHFWLQLILAGDIHPNPGPDQLRGKISLGFWNLNSILARDS